MLEKVEVRARAAVGRPALRALRFLRSARFAVGVLVAVYLVLGSVWAAVIPLGEGPDEAGHWDYALFVARERRLPVQRAAAADVPGEGHQPPLAYWLLQPVARSLPAEERVVRVAGNPQFRWAGGDEINAYRHGSREAWPWRGDVLAWHVARLVSVACGAGSLLFVWATGMRLWPTTPEIALGATALVAFNPQWLFQHALVSNDPLLWVLVSGLVWLAVRRVTQPAQNQKQHGRAAALQGSPAHLVSKLLDPLLLGLLLGGALLTKQSAIAFVPVPLAAIWLGSGTWRQRVRDVTLVAGVAALVAGWWYARNVQLYGDAFGLSAFQAEFAVGDFDPGRWADWRAGGESLLRSSWGVFGWQTVFLPGGVYHMAGMMLVLGAIGVVMSVGRGAWHGRGRAALVLGLALVLALAWTAAFARTAGRVGWQGRFVFPVIVAWAVVLACGLAQLAPRRAALRGAVVVLALLAMLLPGSVVRPAYPTLAARPQTVPPANVYGAFDQGWNRGAELRHVDFPLRATSGTTATITLTWYVAEPLDRDWSVFVHVADANDVLVAKLDATPLAGRYPTTAWLLGDWVRDPLPLSLRDAPPGVYEVRVGLFDPFTTDRLDVRNAQRKLVGDYLVVGRMTVE